jgi:hypothetical protein
VEDFFTTEDYLKERMEALDKFIFAKTDRISDKKEKSVVDFVYLVFSSILSNKISINAVLFDKE